MNEARKSAFLFCQLNYAELTAGRGLRHEGRSAARWNAERAFIITIVYL